MAWTTEQKREAALRGPIGSHLLREDSMVFDADGWYRIITPSAPWPGVNEVVLSQVDARDPDGDIRRVVEEYRSRDLPLKWCVYPWSQPSNLGERLLDLGAIRWASRGMVCDTALELGVPEGLRVERIERETLARYVATSAEGWEIPPAEARFLAQGLDERLSTRPAEMALFVVHRGDEAAATAAVRFDGAAGYLLGANVLARHQGHGVYRALLAARLQALRERGVSLATTQAREHTSAPMLEHLGFETVFRATTYLLNPRPPSPSRDVL